VIKIRRKVKKYLLILLLIVGGLFITGCTAEPTAPVEKSPTIEEKTMSNLQFPGVLPDEKIKNKKAVIKTAKGTIEFDLYADKAPKTGSNFVYLAEKGYYDGLIFHRIVPDFVVQGGDPTGTGMGGPGYKFEDEPVVGEYVEGSVAMANSGPNTNGSQFFISTVDNSKNLAKAYNLFGQVTSGMDVVKKLTQGDKMESVTIVNK